tara:strand:+ start:2076 stop:2825 length:750 start_codon:yes stop_codon:yes gene_type:complete
MFEDLDNNFKKNASKPIQTDVKKMDSVEKELSEEPKEHYEKTFDNNNMTGLLSLFENKLRSKLEKQEKQDEQETSDTDFDTINVTQKNLVIKTSDSKREVSENEISDLLASSKKESLIKVVSSSEKNQKNKETTNITNSFSELPTPAMYEDSANTVDPNHNIKVFKDNNQPSVRYEETQNAVDPSSNLQNINYSGATGLSQSIGQGYDSQRISDEEIAMHLAEHNRKKEEEAEQKRLNSVVEVPEHLKT